MKKDQVQQAELAATGQNELPKFKIDDPKFREKEEEQPMTRLDSTAAEDAGLVKSWVNNSNTIYVQFNINEYLFAFSAGALDKNYR